MKAGPVVKAVAELGLPQLLVHTGQHYDRALSDVFFEELGLPRPDRNLEVGSGSQAAQTAALLTALDAALPEIDPSMVVVYGDVNSTLAAALVASKRGIPLAHVEAGLRSFDRTMPEEINRVVTDSLSDLLFVTSPEAIANLRREGAADAAIHFVGNPMIDTLLANLDRLDAASARAAHDLGETYAVATLHRPANVDAEPAARALVAMLRGVAARLPVVLPLHPRGRATLERVGLLDVPDLRVVEPLGYVPFLSLVRGAALVITDSGGIQEETTILGVPCLTVRPNTERPITISHGTNRLVRPGEVAGAVDEVLAGGPGTRPTEPPPLWDGHAGARIAAVLAEPAPAR
jgi:UDP-N-acetylglucosamine 2-epimerase (non-hydrolysing)